METERTLHRKFIAKGKGEKKKLKGNAESREIRACLYTVKDTSRER